MISKLLARLSKAQSVIKLHILENYLIPSSGHYKLPSIKQLKKMRSFKSNSLTNYIISRENFDGIVVTKPNYEGRSFNTDLFWKEYKSCIFQCLLGNTFSNCLFDGCSFIGDFSNAVFESCTFLNCDFSEANCYSIAVNSGEMNNVTLSKTSDGMHLNRVFCSKVFIDSISKDCNSVTDLSEYHAVPRLMKRTSSVRFSSELEEYFYCRKKSLAGVLKFPGNDGKLYPIPCIFRQSNVLMGIIFLKTYKVDGGYLYKNCLYILAKDQNGQKNKTRDEFVDIFSKLPRFKIKSKIAESEENLSFEKIESLIVKEKDLQFQFVRPIHTQEIFNFNYLSEKIVNRVEN